jgi:hypothetical protein
MLTSGTLTIGVWTGAETFTETSGSDGPVDPDGGCDGDAGDGSGTLTLTVGSCGGFGTLTVTVGACGRSGPGADEGGLPPEPSG